MLASFFVGFLAVITLVWAWLQVSNRYRNNLEFRLEPIEDSESNDEGKAWPHVVIFCPGRNEAEHLDTLLPQLCEQDYPDYHVVFIDDHSDDDTPRITAEMAERYPHLTVVRNDADPPPGWVGKCWAIKRGYDEFRAREEEAQSRERRDTNHPSPTTNHPAPLVCFTDADVRWHTQCIRRAVEAMDEHEADIVSLFPGMEFGSTVERLTISTLALALNALFPVERALDPDDPEALLAGAFALVKRDLYDKIDGHEAVKNCVVEDINLGRRLKAAGGRLWFAHTYELVHCRMYDGWSDLWEGLTKNAYAGTDYNPFAALGLIMSCVFGCVLPPVFLVGGAVWLAMGGGWHAGATVGLSAAILLMHARAMNRVRRVLRLPAYYAFSTPAGAGIYLLLFVASVWRYYRGGNIWKGRAYGRAVTAESS